VGEEVVRRYCDGARDAGEDVLKAMAGKTLQEEGYEPEAGELKIVRQQPTGS
jgi:hypothetical protein